MPHMLPHAFVVPREPGTQNCVHTPVNVQVGLPHVCDWFGLFEQTRVVVIAHSHLPSANAVPASLQMGVCVPQSPQAFGVPDEPGMQN